MVPRGTNITWKLGPIGRIFHLGNKVLKSPCLKGFRELGIFVAINMNVQWIPKNRKMRVNEDG